MTLEQLLIHWENADHVLRAAKIQEDRLRDRLTAVLMADNPNATGTFNFFVGDREVRVVINESVSLDEAEYAIHKGELTDAEKEAVEFTPHIKKGELNKLPKDCILATECVSKKHNKPSVKIIS